MGFPGLLGLSFAPCNIELWPASDFDVEFLFDDRHVIVVAANSK
jgi:hypothetical protein